MILQRDLLPRFRGAPGELPRDRRRGGYLDHESSPNPITAVEEALLPSVRAMAASITL